jgi:cysteine desulfurase
VAVNFQLYLDACAATPPHGEVLAAMASHGLEAWGNPSSLHAEGLKAADLLERSRLEVAS